MNSVFQIIRLFCDQSHKLDEENIPVVTRACCNTFLTSTIGIITEFKSVLTLADRARCDVALKSLLNAKATLSRYTEYDFDEEFCNDILAVLQKFTGIFTSAHTEMIAYHLHEQLTPITPPLLPEELEERQSILEQLLERDGINNRRFLATNEQTNSVIEFAKANKLFLAALLSKNADHWWEQAPENIKTTVSACSQEMRNYIQEIDSHRNLKRRAAILMPPEFIYNSRAQPVKTDRFDHETSCPGMACSGMLSNLIDGLVGLTENTHKKKIIQSRWFALNEADEVQELIAQVNAANLPSDVKKSLVFNIAYDELGERVTSATCQYGQGRFEFCNHTVIKSWLGCTTVDDTALDIAKRALVEVLNFSWAIRTVDLGAHIHFEREDHAVLQLLLFRFPRLEEIFTTHLTHLQQAAQNWHAYQLSQAPRLPLSPIKIRSPKADNVLSRTSPINTRNRAKRILDDDDNHVEESAVHENKRTKQVGR